MKAKNRLIAILLTVALSLGTLLVPGYAAVQPEPDSGEYAYAYLLPENAENVQYVNNGTILFKDGNEYKYIDGQTGKVIIAAVEYRVVTRIMSIGSEPKDLSPTWQFIRREGPYQTTVDLFAVADALEDINDWVQVCAWFGIPAVLANWIKGKVNGGYKTTAYWRFDDSYNNPNSYQGNLPYTVIHIESYYYASQSCSGGTYIGSDSHEMRAST